MPHERNQDRSIRRRLRQRGALEPVKLNPTSGAGLPDFVTCYRGRFVALEDKTDDGRTTRLQDWRLEQIRKAGGYAAVVRSARDVDRLLDEIDADLALTLTPGRPTERS